jgi:predicted phage tail component-like protein
MQSDISYDGFNFRDNGLVVTSENHMIIAARNNQIEKIAGRQGGTLVQSELGTKTIPIAGYYYGATTGAVQVMYDTLASMLNRQERELLIPHAGEYRRFIATPQNTILQQPMGLNRLTFDFEFIVPSGSSQDSSYTTLLNSTVTTATATQPFTVDSSVLSRPRITLTFTSVTSGTAKTVTLRNARDFIGLSITRNFVTGDVITIDSDNFQIYINGVLTEPDGRMPTWSPGSASLFYSDTFSARSVNIKVEDLQRNL